MLEKVFSSVARYLTTEMTLVCAVLKAFILRLVSLATSWRVAKKTKHGYVVRVQ